MKTLLKSIGIIIVILGFACGAFDCFLGNILVVIGFAIYCKGAGLGWPDTRSPPEDPW